jgi:predicted N-acetyltransferase YhbS
VVGTARLWNVGCGNGARALLLGPVAVSEDCRGRGVGADLVQRSLREARRLGHGVVVLVGDAAYYGRFGFSAERTGALWLAGRYQQHRLLGCELVPDALLGARGRLAAAGRPEQEPALDVLVAALQRQPALPQAA